jgi:hypothetical protein
LKLSKEEKAIIEKLQNGAVIRCLDYRLHDSFVSPTFVQWMVKNGIVQEVEIEGMKFWRY